MTATNEAISRIVERLAAVPNRLDAAFALLQDADAVLPPQPGEWSPAEVLAHLRAAHAIMAPRILAILARDNPALPAFDDRRWQQVARYLDLPLTDSLAALRLQRAELIRALRGLAPADWERAGTHEISGRITVLSVAQAIAEHDEEHCAQLLDRLGGSP